MKKMVSKIVPSWLKSVIAMFIYKIFRFRIRIKKCIPKVNKFDETVNYIIDKRVSVSRFGEGEFQWIFLSRGGGNFEINSPELSESLKWALNLESNDLIICIPDVFSGLSKYTSSAKRFWSLCLGKYGMLWINELSDKSYYDALFSRPYMDYKDKNNAGIRFQLIRKIWEERNVLIVEGAKSRLGVGNDLLENAKSVRRILAPEVNAFEKYDEIKKTIIENIDNEDTLLLLALGPTATVLAAELSTQGVQSIDIGHLDVEYSWYLMNATSKVPIKGKYVNESINEKFIDGIIDKKYMSEIVSEVE